MNKAYSALIFAVSFLMLFFLMAPEGHAQITQNTGFLNDITNMFKSQSALWSTAMIKAAKYLFITLAGISLVFSFCFMAVEGLELGKIYSTLLRFLVVVGLFWFFLENAPAIAGAIIKSFSQLAGKASASNAATPSGIIDIGFSMFSKLAAAADRMKLITGILANLIALGVLIVLCLIAANVTIEWCATYVLIYAGVIVLGFGSLTFTREFAIQYLKTLLAQGIKLMTMILLASLAADFITTLGNNTAGVATVGDCAVMLVASLVILLIMNKVPAMMAGLIGGSPSISTLGVGTALAVGGLAVGGAAMVATGSAAIGKAVKEGLDKLGKAAAGASGEGGGDGGSGSLSAATSGSGGAKGGIVGAFSNAMGKGLSGLQKATQVAQKTKGTMEKSKQTLDKINQEDQTYS